VRDGKLQPVVKLIVLTGVFTSCYTVPFRHFRKVTGVKGSFNLFTKRFAAQLQLTAEINVGNRPLRLLIAYNVGKGGFIGNRSGICASKNDVAYIGRGQPGELKQVFCGGFIQVELLLFQVGKIIK